ncbi:ExbD/TolR family protein [Halpernia frigidisoli]|uniref:Outer membrane transport energization protein ExbD n=1 Tax=Halpernia frigidisoli TaxID=1125876 RepID=A0A1I3GXB8_9FLAO|nr:biopolymer transporter ExbD [Halpernia frigidisoli]SFI28016.1 outer membrane transport energization protein ExbD [Halpernia frigidisoli]
MELKRRNRVNAEFSMASMTDIIFLLLIFFMITSSAISQSAIDVKLPKADATETSAQDPSTVTIKEDGTYYINDKAVPKENLESYLVNVLKNETTPTFTIRADGNTKHKDVVFVMEIAEKHKYNLAIATTQE